MKITKITTLAVLIAMTSISLAGTKIKMGTNEVDAVEFCTSWGSSHTNEAIGHVEYAQNINNLTSKEFAKCDALLAANGNYSRSSWSKSVKDRKFPQCTVNSKVFYSSKYKTNTCEYVNKFIDGTIGESNITLIDWIVRAELNLEDGIIISKYNKDIILRYSASYAKKTIRKEGKSFVGEEGVKLIKSYVDAVSTALNAPKYAGLKKSLSDIGMDFGLDFELKSLSDEQVETLKQKILDGEVDFNMNNQQILEANLGVENYNKFVKIYNEGGTAE